MSEPKASPAVVAAIIALCVFGAAILWLNRYEVSSVGPVPMRLDRFTGQVIGCLPNSGCIEFIPVGTPELRESVMRREPAPAQVAPPAGAPAGNAQAAPAPAVAAAPPSSPAAEAKAGPPSKPR
jgi:hypothetical protein